jgi:hypothetical protein
LSKLPTVAKAITAGATAFGASFATANLDNYVSSSEWITISIATLLAVIAVWAVPNKPDEVTPG